MLRIRIPLLFTLGVVTLDSSCAAQSAPATVAAALDSIPFELDDARIYVAVSDSTALLGWFILDTGAQPTVVDVDVVRRWGDQAGGGSTITGAGGGRTQVASLEGRLLRVGAVPLRPPTLSVLPLDTLLGAVSGRRISGIIGSAFFREHTVTIDFDRKLLYVRPAGSAFVPNGATEITLDLRGDIPHHNGTVQLPDGRTIEADFLIDLGAKATVLFTEPFLERTRVSKAITGPSFVAPLGAGVGGRTRYRFARVPEIALTGAPALHWRDAVVGLSVDGTLRQTFFDGLFGLEMLRNYAPTFDYAHSRLLLAPRAVAQPLSEIDLSGLSLVEQRTPRALRVTEVAVRSPASEAGILPGDELLAVDGTPASTLSLGQVRELLRSTPGRIVTLQLRRSATTVERTLTLRRMA